MLTSSAHHDQIAFSYRELKRLGNPGILRVRGGADREPPTNTDRADGNDCIEAKRAHAVAVGSDAVLPIPVVTEGDLAELATVASRESTRHSSQECGAGLDLRAGSGRLATVDSAPVPEELCFSRPSAEAIDRRGPDAGHAGPSVPSARILEVGEVAYPAGHGDDPVIHLSLVDFPLGAGQEARFQLLVTLQPARREVQPGCCAEVEPHDISKLVVDVGSPLAKERELHDDGKTRTVLLFSK